MISKEPDSPEDKHRKVSEESRSRGRDKPTIQKGRDRVEYWERTLEFGNKMLEDANRKWTAEK